MYRTDEYVDNYKAACFAAAPIASNDQWKLFPGYMPLKQ
jgi:hypothetical protein